MDEKRLQEIRDAVNAKIEGRWDGTIPLPESVFDEAVQRIREYNYPKRNEEIASVIRDDTENRKLVRELLAAHDEQAARIAVLERALGVIRGMASLGHYRNIDVEHSQAKLREIQAIADEAVYPKGQS